jgi:20S proteasome alpha/beta subunit
MRLNSFYSAPNPLFQFFFLPLLCILSAARFFFSVFSPSVLFNTFCFSQLLETSKTLEKMYKIDNHVISAVAGITADANILINSARLSAQRHTLTYGEPVPVEQLVQSVCDLKQGYTQHGGVLAVISSFNFCCVTNTGFFFFFFWSPVFVTPGLRPFGVSFLWAGWDSHFGFQLYQSDPSGNYGGWKATSIGGNSQSAQSMLKQVSRDCNASLYLIVMILNFIFRVNFSSFGYYFVFCFTDVFLICINKYKKYILNSHGWRAGVP